MTAPQPSLAERDLAVVWHPCTQMHDHETLPMVPIARAEGAWLTGTDGRRYLDAVASWWTCLLGHRHPRVVAALHEQLDSLDHVMLAGFTHAPAVELAEELVRITPRGLSRVFYADNGSSAVEVALKLSFHYWRNCGEARTRFVTLSGGYHGETLGALSVTDVPLYRDTYGPLLLDPIIAPSPDGYRIPPARRAAHVTERLASMRKLLEQHAGTVCAVIVEPLVQCAAGMRMYPPEYLTGLRALCDEFRLHLIADEIAVGFGRTGTLFGCEQGGIAPDLMCLSKGLTGGTMALSAVLATGAIYDAFYADWSAGKAFLHSHSFTGNPIACRAALATLSVLREEPVLPRVRELAAHLAARIAPFANHPQVGDVRQTGLIAAIELVRDRRSGDPFPASERRGLRVYRHGLEHGVVLRPLGNVVYFMPPFCITPDEIDTMVDVAAAGIDRAVA